MTPSPTYAQFLFAFVVIPILLLFAVGTRLAPHRKRAAVGGVVAMVTVAVVYTVPWDNYLVSVGVWTYGEGTVAARIGYAPVEEYLFIALQPVLTSLWLYRWPLPEATPRVRLPWQGEDPMIAGGWFALAGGGALALAGETLYMGAIVVWAAPVLALQWAVGGQYLWAVRRRLVAAVAVPTLYLAMVDRLAIAWGIWELSPEYTTGLMVGGLPVEEGLFFLVTNLLVVQGLLLYHRVVETWA